MELSEKILNKLYGTFIKNLFSEGKLTLEDLHLSELDLTEKVNKLIKNVKIGFVIDHRNGILGQAEFYLKSKNYNYAKIFYAMFFEHSINSLIDYECRKRNIEEKTKIDIIKSVDLYGKLTWLPILFEHNKFNKTHLQTIKRLADDRNSFVHYKWKIKSEDSEESSLEKEMQIEFKKIKHAVKYMKSYESNIFFGKNKGKLERRINNKLPTIE